MHLNIFLLQHKGSGIGHKFKNLDRPLPIQVNIQSTNNTNKLLKGNVMIDTSTVCIKGHE